MTEEKNWQRREKIGTSITVLVERHAKQGKEEELLELFKELRTVYVSQPGYISSQILQREDDKSIIFAVTAWADAAAREAYAKNPKRLEIIPKIEAVLAEPQRLFFLKTIS